MGNTKKLLELSKELVSIKELELKAMTDRLKAVDIAEINEFIVETAPNYQKTPAYLESSKDVAIASIRQKIVQLKGEYEGAKEQVTELEQELADAKDLQE